MTLEEKLKERYPNYQIELVKSVAPEDFSPRVGLRINGIPIKTIWKFDEAQNELAMQGKFGEEELEKAFFKMVDEQILTLSS